MKLLIITTALAGLSLSAAQTSAKVLPANPQGPQPYQATNPVYPPMKHEAAIPNVAYVPPLLFLKDDDAHGSAAGPQPYSAPDPVY